MEMSELNSISLDILVANYNNAPYIDDCFESIQELSKFLRCRVIVIDDNSLDDSLTKLSKWQNKLDMTLLSNARNMGVAYTKHRLFQECSSEFCVFLDPDDAIIPEGVVGILKRFIAAESNVLCMYGKHVRCDAEMREIEVVGNDISKGNSHWNLGSELGISHPAFFRPKRLMPHLIKLDFPAAVDQQFYLAASHFGEVIFVPVVGYRYRLTGSGVYTANPERAVFYKSLTKFKLARRYGISSKAYLESSHSALRNWVKSGTLDKQRMVAIRRLLSVSVFRPYLFLGLCYRWGVALIRS
jgi:glycosyltransferase involved in cell wall biosynthesis